MRLGVHARACERVVLVVLEVRVFRVVLVAHGCVRASAFVYECVRVCVLSRSGVYPAAVKAAISSASFSSALAGATAVIVLVSDFCKTGFIQY